MEEALAIHTFLAEMSPCVCADETERVQQKIRVSKEYLNFEYFPQLIHRLINTWRFYWSKMFEHHLWPVMG